MTLGYCATIACARPCIACGDRGRRTERRGDVRWPRFAHSRISRNPQRSSCGDRRWLLSTGTIAPRWRSWISIIPSVGWDRIRVAEGTAAPREPLQAKKTEAPTPPAQSVTKRGPQLDPGRDARHSGVGINELLNLAEARRGLPEAGLVFAGIFGQPLRFVIDVEPLEPRPVGHLLMGGVPQFLKLVRNHPHLPIVPARRVQFGESVIRGRVARRYCRLARWILVIPADKPDRYDDYAWPCVRAKPQLPIRGQRRLGHPELAGHGRMIHRARLTHQPCGFEGNGSVGRKGTTRSCHLACGTPAAAVRVAPASGR